VQLDEEMPLAMPRSGHRMTSIRSRKEDRRRMWRLARLAPPGPSCPMAVGSGIGGDARGTVSDGNDDLPGLQLAAGAGGLDDAV
jgi:hypothetical protein